MLKIYIDGQAGTTGLALEERLQQLKQSVALEIMKIPDELRKDAKKRKELLNLADVVFLCLPDDAAIDAASMIENPNTVIIDASTAHRTDADWAYGFPELSTQQLEKIKTSNKISVPGCHATGFIALIHPLVEKGIVDVNAKLVCQSLTGYSGGGKELIEVYEQPNTVPDAAWMYSLGLTHKHLPEMKHWAGLINSPIFIPTVVPIHHGMIVSVPLNHNVTEVQMVLKNYYQGSKTIKVMDANVVDNLGITGEMSPEGIDIYVFGNDEQTVVSAKLDNLGKGSSGAAVQCMKVRLGL